MTNPNPLGVSVISHASPETTRLRSLESVLGVPFGDRDLLAAALVHSSYYNENRDSVEQSNERLEYLGDALLGAVVAEELFRRYPDWSEGELTSARVALVRGETLASVGSELDLGGYLLLGRGEEGSGGRKRPSNIAAALEAVIGAAFLDRGYAASKELVLRLLAEPLSKVARGAQPASLKATLQELVQGSGLGPPTYAVVTTEGLDHARTFTVEVSVDGRVMGRGVGRRKSQAEEEAAGAALETMEDEG